MKERNYAGHSLELERTFRQVFFYVVFYINIFLKIFKTISYNCTITGSGIKQLVTNSTIFRYRI